MIDATAPLDSKNQNDKKMERHADIETKGNERIGRYLLAHPTLLVSCVSAMIAVASITINVATEIQISKVLYYWGFYDITSPVTNVLWTHKIAMSIIIFVLNEISCFAFSFTSRSFFSETEAWRKLKQLCKLRKRQLRKLKRNLTHINIAMCNLKKEGGSTTELEIELDDMNKLYDNLKADVEEAKQLPTNVIKIIALRWVALALLFVLTLGFLLSILLALNSLETLNVVSPFMASILFELSIFVTMSIIEYTQRAQFTAEDLREIEQSGEYANKRISEILEETIQKAKTKKKLFSTDFILSNRNIITFLMCYIGIIAMVMLFSISLGDESLDRKKDFNIWNGSGDTYAIVYSQGNTYYMDKAEIAGDTLTIITSEHRVITSEDISFETKHFSNIVPIAKSGIESK